MVPETPTCHGLNCTKPATVPCTDCEPITLYCSTLCLKADYKRHKKHCSGTEKSNCFLIRAPKGTTNTGADNNHIEKFHLCNFGIWENEKTELKQRLGWKEANEGGKFYSYNKNAHSWYYYVYHSGDTSQPQNEIVSRCSGRTVYGDAAIVRSSPIDCNDYSDVFSRGELLKTLAFYRDHDPRVVFGERESTRVEKRFGMRPGSLGRVPHIVIN